MAFFIFLSIQSTFCLSAGLCDSANKNPQPIHTQKAGLLTGQSPDSGKKHWHVNVAPVQRNDGIPVASLKSSGLDSQFISSMHKSLVASEFSEVHSLLIYTKSALVYEYYQTGNDDFIEFENDIFINSTRPDKAWNVTDKHYVASVNKTISALVAGLVLSKIQEGDDDFEKALNTPLKRYLQDLSSYFDQPSEGSINLQHLLTMQLGYNWDEWGGDDLRRLWKEDHFAPYLLNKKHLKAGDGWVYNSAAPNLLMQLLEDQLQKGGQKVGLSEFVDEHLYRAMGIHDYRWETQPDGYPEASARLYLRPRDMLKFGILMLNQGEWQGAKIIPRSWIALMTQAHAKLETLNYGFYTWLAELKPEAARKGDTLEGERYFYAEGDGGQYIIVFPKRELVLVFTQGLYGQWALYSQQKQDLLERFIVPASQNGIKH